MRPTRSRSRRTSAADARADAEGGFTLIELIVTCSLLVVVVGMILTSLVSVMQAEAFQSDRNVALDSMRTTMNRLTKELRQATQVSTSSTESQLIFDSYQNGVPTTYAYVASGSTLTRQVGSDAPVVIEKGVADTQIFTYTDAPPTPGAQWVRIELEVKPPRSPDTVLVLESEINLRNRVLA